MEHRLLVIFILVCVAEISHGCVLFSSLPRALLIASSAGPDQVLDAGEDKIEVTWGLNRSYGGQDKLYKKVKVVLCFAPASQVDRGWRKTNDDLSKDQSCQFTVVEKDYDSSMTTQSTEWKITDEVPTGTYFMRVYAYDWDGKEVGFGQTTDVRKSNNLFVIKGFVGTHLSLQIASACFSVFSVASLVGFLFMDKRKNNSSAANCESLR